jgi:hypothetical protein
LTERRHPARAQGFKLLAPERDQFIFFFHLLEVAAPLPQQAERM